MVQQMIENAFFALGISGKTQKSTSKWYLDSGASHHMTNSSHQFSQLKPYYRNLRINTADGGSIPIAVVGEFQHPLP